MTAIVAAGVGHHYGERVALHDVDLTVAPGELCVLLGHNGSGKSTLLRILAGLQRQTSGTVSVGGARPGTIKARAVVSYAGDMPVLYDDLSVREHLEFTARLHGLQDWHDQAEEVAAALGIADRLDDLPLSLSRGLRQRAALAVALGRPFKVLLIDEPFVGLDPDGRGLLADLLYRARADGAAVVVATHQLDALAAADHAVVLSDGAKVHDGPPALVPRDAHDNDP